MSNELERSLNKQAILDEDEYTAALSQIIARDFFPSLVHLDATNEYLDAVQTRDPHLIAASVQRLEQVGSTPLPGPSSRSSSSRRRAGVHPSQTPSQTPYAAFPTDTPRLYDEGHGGEDEGRGGEEEPTNSKRPRYDINMSLDEFQARYTSEDNSSFTQIMDEENKNRMERYTWAWEAQKRVEKQRDRMIEARERMLIEPAPAPGVKERFRIEATASVGLITDGGSSHGSGKQEEEKTITLKATSVEEAARDVMAPRKDPRPAGVDGWKFKTRNSLMFAPDADTSPYHPPPPNSSAEKKTEPKVISYRNTRLHEQEHSTNPSGLSEPPSPTRSRIEAAINGTPYRPRSPSLSDVDSLVPNLPNPTPEQLGPAAVKQLMTWGTLNATPRVLSRPEDEDVAPPITPSTPFHIRAVSSREALSHKLANSASKSLKAKAEIMGLRTPGVLRTPNSRGVKEKGDMGPPSWTPRRAEAAGNLTPAARRLLERSTIGTVAAKRSERKTQESDLNRVRWTPTPAAARPTG